MSLPVSSRCLARVAAANCSSSRLSRQHNIPEHRQQQRGPPHEPRAAHRKPHRRRTLHRLRTNRHAQIQIPQRQKLMAPMGATQIGQKPAKLMLRSPEQTPRTQLARSDPKQPALPQIPIAQPIHQAQPRDFPLERFSDARQRSASLKRPAWRPRNLHHCGSAEFLLRAHTTRNFLQMRNCRRRTAAKLTAIQANSCEAYLPSAAGFCHAAPSKHRCRRILPKAKIQSQLAIFGSMCEWQRILP